MILPENRVYNLHIAGFGGGRKDAAEVSQDGVHTKQSYKTPCEQSCNNPQKKGEKKEKALLGKRKRSLSCCSPC